MKKRALLTLILAVTAVISCVSEGDYIVPDANQSPTITQTDTSAFVDSTGVFEMLNLSHPGLEKVKAALEANDTLAAAKALLDYWRYDRTAVNPYIDLINPKATESELRIADQACEAQTL